MFKKIDKRLYKFIFYDVIQILEALAISYLTLSSLIKFNKTLEPSDVILILCLFLLIRIHTYLTNNVKSKNDIEFELLKKEILKEREINQC